MNGATDIVQWMDRMHQALEQMLPDVQRCLGELAKVEPTKAARLRRKFDAMQRRSEQAKAAEAEREADHLLLAICQAVEQGDPAR